MRTPTNRGEPLAPSRPTPCPAVSRAPERRVDHDAWPGRCEWAPEQIEPGLPYEPPQPARKALAEKPSRPHGRRARGVSDDG